MKLEFEITYDAGKLAKEMKSIVKAFLKDTGEAFVEGSKKAIESGKFRKLEQSTLDVRKAGTSRGGKGAYGKSISSNKPLVHTGRFLKRLKLLKNGDMSVHKYALNHLPDDIFDISEESIVTQVTAEARGKSGIAYTTASDSMIPNKPVPIRNWFRMDKNLAKKSISKFKKQLKDNFEITKWEAFRKYA